VPAVLYATSALASRPGRTCGTSISFSCGKMCPLSSFIGILQVLQVTSIPSLQGSHYRLGGLLDCLDSVYRDHMTGTQLISLDGCDVTSNETAAG
jgi:hypothetical protein